MIVKGEICMTKPSYSDGRNRVNIWVNDVEAGIRFLEIEEGA